MAKKKVINKPSRFSRFISKILVLTVVVLVCLIILKSNADLRNKVYKNVFQDNFSFAKINEIYKKYFGSSLPLHKEDEKSAMVSAEKLEYTSSEKYKEGVKLTVKEGYLVPSQDSGLVIFAGEKEGYGKTVIVQRPDGVEVWYGNMNNIASSLYDYIKKGDNIGESNGSFIYMVFMKEGKALDYQKYI